MLKKHQPPMSVNEQIQNLKSLNCKIENEKEATEFLNNVSYFRLIKWFGFSLKEKNSQYTNNVSFKQIKGLYLFNAKFRHLIFPEIEKVEINFRCRIGNYFSNKYGVLGHKDSRNFQNAERHQRFIEELNNEITRNQKAPFVKNFQINYEGGELPLYAAIELFSFGTLSKFFKNMKGEDKKAIATEYNVPYLLLESWVEHLAFVRNICAHYGRLYNVNFSKTPILYREYTDNNISSLRVYASLICLKHLLPRNEHWEQFVGQIGLLLSDFPCVDKKLMGFPDELWANYLIHDFT
jgi:abortive infection bacteriophage resistance protein